MKHTVGQNLKKFREANRFTQEQVAKHLEITRSAYSNYELGERDMPIELLEKATDLFGCELAALFEENCEAVESMVACAFRVDNLSDADIHEIATFKAIVKNYMKMKRLIADATN